MEFLLYFMLEQLFFCKEFIDAIVAVANANNLKESAT
jgi:hypothetical protein